MQGFDFYTVQSLEISIITKDHKVFKWIPLRESSLFARLGMVYFNKYFKTDSFKHLDNRYNFIPA